jgi:hypothetical protein
MDANESDLKLRFIESLSAARFVPISRGRQVAKGRGRESFKSFSSDNHIFQSIFQVREEAAFGQFGISNMRRFLSPFESWEYFFRSVDGDSAPRAGL